MKKLVVLCITAAILLFGCVSSPAVPKEKQRVFQVLEFPGMGKDAIFDGAQKGMAKLFVTSKVVIERQDKGQGVIVGKGTVPVQYGTLTAPTAFTITIEAQDERMRTSFTDLSMSVMKSGTTSNSPLTTDEDLNRFYGAMEKIIESLRADVSNPLVLVLVPGGTFTMGSPEGEDGRDGEEVQHRVSLSDFSIAATEVTQAQYESLMGANPSSNKGDFLPVEGVTWYDAVAYCNKLSETEKLGKVYTISGTKVSVDWEAKGYRLPTEAEWEYAAKGGLASSSLAANAVYAGNADPNEVAWYDDNSENTTHPVGQKAANALGIYDMAGNVLEWCWDLYSDYSSDAQSDPRGASSGVDRAFRGGSWGLGLKDLRSSSRGSYDPGGSGDLLGFRVVRRP